MIKIQGRIPRNVTVACSGGVDSMAIVDFLKRSHNLTIAYFDHGTKHGQVAKKFLEQYSAEHDIFFITGGLKRDRFSDESQEEYWRNQRYEFLDSIEGTVITGHHLDDCVETWIMSSLHGTGKWIPYRRNNVIRPFRLNPKSVFQQWSKGKAVPYVEDCSNKDTKYIRNYIRHEMMPHVLKVNPGIYKTLYKKITDEMKDETLSIAY